MSGFYKKSLLKPLAVVVGLLGLVISLMGSVWLFIEPLGFYEHALWSVAFISCLCVSGPLLLWGTNNWNRENSGLIIFPVALLMTIPSMAVLGVIWGISDKGKIEIVVVFFLVLFTWNKLVSLYWNKLSLFIRRKLGKQNRPRRNGDGSHKE
jgi:Kef-type K+ transport system membrane component KefB